MHPHSGHLANAAAADNADIIEILVTKIKMDIYTHIRDTWPMRPQPTIPTVDPCTSCPKFSKVKKYNFFSLYQYVY
jgi:hypothetical protein